MIKRTRKTKGKTQYPSNNKMELGMLAIDKLGLDSPFLNY